MGKRLRSPAKEDIEQPTKPKNKLYVCTCERYCHRQKQVSKRTLARHSQYRDRQHYSSGSSSGPESSSESNSNTSGSSGSGSDDESDSDNSDIHIPPNKKARFHEPNSAENFVLSEDSTEAFGDDDFAIVNDHHFSNSGRTSPANSDFDRADPGSLDDDSHPDSVDIPEDSDGESDDSEVDADDAGVVHDVADLKTALAFIAAVKKASLDNGDLDSDVVSRLRKPATKPPDISDPADLHLLRNFIATTHIIKKKVAEWSGVVPILSHMCPNSCMAFTGPWSERDTCRFCGAARYDPITGRPQEFHTIAPLGPQLQALYGHPESAKKMHYRREKTAEILATMDANGQLDIPVYEDYIHGRDYLEAVICGDIKDTDIVIIGSIDGAQLYRNKQSDCWISIYIIGEMSPLGRFKIGAIFPDSFIPGPKKPKHLDSFKFPGVHHLAALQKEGMQIWDAYDDKVVTSRPFLLMETADGPGMTGLNGLVGHHGVYGCRLYCPLKGRNKEGKPHYYPVMTCPTGYAPHSHPDVDPKSLPQPSETEYHDNLQYLLGSVDENDYKERRKMTGICKPSLFSALPRKHRLGIPGCFPADIMHLGMNWTDVVLSLFRGTIQCEKPDSKDSWDFAVLVGDVWKAHGKEVADATPYLPGSFDRPPRNPAEKMSSGYKAWEFLLYVVGLGPALFYKVLPYEHYRHFCKGAAVFRCFGQYRIPVEMLRQCHKLAIEYIAEFETLYFEGMPERIHFVRQSIHAFSHLGPEAIRVGPASLYSELPMERTIGNLGREIRSHSQPYANLSERGLRRSQVNALYGMFPHLDPHLEKPLPCGSIDLGDGFVLLRAKDEHGHELEGEVARAIMYSGKHQIAEVQFYFWAKFDDAEHALALVDWYSEPCPNLLEHSYGTLWSCGYEPGKHLAVIPVQSILSVVAMIPHNVGEEALRYFLVEKPGLDMISLAGYQEADDAQMDDDKKS
ncbi:hypothetical protein MVEN_00051600 [Mycena venus]|uniref:Uncharacterized protein n=1 Tax=Mycena venus TaxID=2733690 RepID=A0A8H7DG65_9AGAR|nr:hypothetical protein MVEN_00051600 [Mycena venus]